MKIEIKTPLEANLLAKRILTGEYAFKWHDRMITLPRADVALEAYNRKPIKSKHMTLAQAMELAAKQSKKTKSKIYINVDEEGNCSTSKTFAVESSVYCYQNGSQIALTTKLKIGDQEKQNNNSMATVKTSNKVAAKKVTAPSPAKKSAPAKEEKKGVEVKGLKLNGKPVTQPEGRAAIWADWLSKGLEGEHTIKGLTYNGKPVKLPEGKAERWKIFLGL